MSSQNLRSIASDIARVRSNGQVTLPASLRRAMDLNEGDALQLVLLEDGSVHVKPIVVMDRLQADLLLRLQLRDVKAIASADLESRARHLARTHQVAVAEGNELDELISRFHRGDISRRAFIGHAIGLGLPTSAISALLLSYTHVREQDDVASPAEPTSDRGGGPVRIAQAFQSLLYLPLYVAQEAGFFAEEGASVEVTTAGGGPQAWDQVVSGNADYSIHDPVIAAAAYEAGMQDAVVVATICNGHAIVAAARGSSIAPVDDPREFVTEVLAGRAVVTQPGADSQPALLRYLAFLYGEEAPVSYDHIQVPIGTEMRALAEGRGDLATSFPPAADIGISQGLHEVFDFSRFFGPYLLSALCTRRGVLQSRPHEHQAVVNALEKAAQYAYAFPADAVEIAQREFPDDDPDVIASATRRCLARHFVPEHVAVDAEAWRESQILNKFAESLEECHEPVELVDNEAALHAYRTLGHLALSWTGPRDLRNSVATSRD